MYIHQLDSSKQARTSLMIVQTLPDPKRAANEPLFPSGGMICRPAFCLARLNIRISPSVPLFHYSQVNT